VRQRLSAAACLLLAGSMPAAAETTAPTPWQFDGTALLYGELAKAQVLEPTGRITRMFANGHSLSAQFAVDVITGASPTGEMPSGKVQTVTSASGTTSTTSAVAIPTHPFSDRRTALDVSWLAPLGSRVTATTAAHYSGEKDYRSVGGNAKLSVDLMSRLTTLTVGGGYNGDEVFPVGGIATGLVGDSLPRTPGSEAKDVVIGLVGLSRVMSRRWLLGVTASRSREQGYLTDPYKMVSLLDPATGLPDAAVNEKRPESRVRNDVLASSVLHRDQNVQYLNYRYYWDDWGVRSHTVDFRLRHDLSDDRWVQPHFRFYEQTRAQFFVFGLIHGPPLPAFASADDRLGRLRTVTLGGTYGFHLPGHSGEFTVRAEYLYQWVAGRPILHGPASSGGEEGEGEGGGGPTSTPIGTHIGTVLAGYSVQF
jgi:hypothetical protein